MNLEVVLADGTVMHTGGLAMKSRRVPPNRPFRRFGGHLGVFTEVVVRLYPLPERVLAARAVFPSVDAASRAAVAVIRAACR